MRNSPGFSLEVVCSLEDDQTVEKIRCHCPRQQIELVAKLFNDPVELPTTLEDGRSDAEDGG